MSKICGSAPLRRGLLQIVAVLASLKNGRLNSRLAPAALVGIIVILTAVVAYHALDSWYLQTANASRLRADYAETAAIRFNHYAMQAIRAKINANQGTHFKPADFDSVFAHIFATRRLLPRQIPVGDDNSRSFIVQVAARDGRVIFSSGRFKPGDYVVRDTLDADIGGMVTAITARRSAAAWLATEHLAWRMSLILWLVGIAAIISLLTARLMLRESKLAHARTSFVSSVSHELRTPLAQIQILLETLRLERYTTPAQRDWIFDGMQREITRLTTLVNNVLQFSRIERGTRRTIASGDRVDLKPLIEDVVAGFAPLASVRSTKLETKLEDGLLVSISQDELRQVVLNLLDNAVKYGPEGQTIRVSTASEGACCSLIVDDEGPGVTHAERTKVWEAFQRGSAVDAATAGSGIGLSVVREIVVANGGRVSIGDAPCGGARFILEIPRATS